MDNTALSLASLVKTNNGLFKSEAQAKFLTSQCQGGSHIASGSVMGNSFMITYFCDSKGVTKVEKYTPKSGKTSIEWERVEQGKVSVQDEKEIKRLKRLIKATEKSIKERQDSWDSGQYGNNVDLFSRAMAHDQEALAALNAKLATF